VLKVSGRMSVGFVGAAIEKVSTSRSRVQLCIHRRRPHNASRRPFWQSHMQCEPCVCTRVDWRMQSVVFACSRIACVVPSIVFGGPINLPMRARDGSRVAGIASNGACVEGERLCVAFGRPRVESGPADVAIAR